ncbi:hypothetical protein D5085_18295 [Ectothiorhodospiraceae bacterium BW-2]|nr:hypothetical protein D5085_18295 [Ectothiorhodospiraceae bacterium BW-2]
MSQTDNNRLSSVPSTEGESESALPTEIESTPLPDTAPAITALQEGLSRHDKVLSTLQQQLENQITERDFTPYIKRVEQLAAQITALSELSPQQLAPLQQQLQQFEAALQQQQQQTQSALKARQQDSEQQQQATEQKLQQQQQALAACQQQLQQIQDHLQQLESQQQQLDHHQKRLESGEQQRTAQQQQLQTLQQQLQQLTEQQQQNDNSLAQLQQQQLESLQQLISPLQQQQQQQQQQLTLHENRLTTLKQQQQLQSDGLADQIQQLLDESQQLQLNQQSQRQQLDAINRRLEQQQQQLQHQHEALLAHEQQEAVTLARIDQSFTHLNQSVTELEGYLGELTEQQQQQHHSLERLDQQQLRLQKALTSSDNRADIRLHYQQNSLEKLEQRQQHSSLEQHSFERKTRHWQKSAVLSTLLIVVAIVIGLVITHQQQQRALQQVDEQYQQQMALLTALQRSGELSRENFNAIIRLRQQLTEQQEPTADPHIKQQLAQIIANIEALRLSDYTLQERNQRLTDALLGLDRKLVRALPPQALYDELWLQQQPSSGFMIQLLAGQDRQKVAQQAQTISRIKPLAIYHRPAKESGASGWYILLGGLYDSFARAESAILDLPAELQRNQPLVRSNRSVLAEMNGE